MTLILKGVRDLPARNVLVAVIFCLPVFCQAQTNDTLFVAIGAKNAQNLYTKAIGVESHLYNGVEYKEHLAHDDDDGIPYFNSNDWTDGALLYDGQVYEDIPILYDVTKDKVVIEHAYSGAKLQLIDEMVGYFSIFGHTFVRLLPDSSASIRVGYYDLLYNGNTKAYARLQKTKNETIADREIRVSFNSNNRFYLFKDGKYHQVKSKASVLKVLADRKPELRKFIRKNRIRFRKDRPKALAEVVKYYDQSGK